jgi:hypothetical protein
MKTGYKSGMLKSGMAALGNFNYFYPQEQRQ